MSEKFEVLTVRDIRFKDKQSDREISGMQLWLITKSSDPSWHGFEVLKIWIDSSSGQAPAVMDLCHGDTVQIEFGRNGKARSITRVAN